MFAVNSFIDAIDVNPGDGFVDTGTPGEVTLRAAIMEANALAGTDTISFNIPGTGPHTIQPLLALPTITDPVVIDGYTQPGASPNTNPVGSGLNTVLMIELDGGNAGDNVDGLHITAGNSTVRGLAINRFDCSGIHVASNGGNTIEGNFIGTDVAGTADLGNRVTGVAIIGASNNTVGGTAVGAQNVISANQTGINIYGSDAIGNVVQGNLVGTDVTGTVNLGNSYRGVIVERGSANVIGGTSTAARNVISGNGSGVYIREAEGNQVSGNFIGTDAAGTAALGNNYGITLYLATDNAVGGTVAGAGNVIAFSTCEGVLVTDSTGIAIRGNSIFSNGDLGIELYPRPVTPNDLGDADTGANNLQNFPELVWALGGSSGTLVQGMLDSTADTTFTIDFYSSSAQDPSGYGEGEIYLGSTDATTDSSGNASFAASFATGVPAGHFLTATATDPGGNTSEFSQAVAALPGFVVNTTDDLDDGVCDATHTSLREAINAANANLGTDTIAFHIPGTGPRTIQPTTELPKIEDPVVVDGYTQPGAVPATETTPASLKIELDGTNIAATNAHGLWITAGSSTVCGLAIHDFRDAIFLTGNGSNLIEGNYLGTDTTGSIVASRSNGSGIYVQCGGNQIGGPTAAARNILSGNTYGVRFVGDVAAGNVVQGNFVGTDAAGVSAVGNWEGVYFQMNAMNNRVVDNVISGNHRGILMDGQYGPPRENVIQGNFIGTDAAGTAALGNDQGVTLQGGVDNTILGNVISGNTQEGVAISDFGEAISSRNVLQGNLIGTDPTGNLPLANGDDGVYVYSPNNIIGGVAPGEGNVISANDGCGLQIAGAGASGNVVQGNLIGTNLSGTSPLGNRSKGVRISDAPGNTIGGPAPGAGNVISANGSAGVYIQSDGASENVVQGNLIGTDISGTLDLGNSGEGVVISWAPDNLIGGISAGAGNVISANDHGVGIASANGNQLLGNLIGTQIDGVSPLGNREYGVYIGANNNAVGNGTDEGANVIAFGGRGGVIVYPYAAENAVRGNVIFSNQGLGIDLAVLGATGVTPNDPGDGDTGANELQNFPVVLSAASRFDTHVRGTLNSIANTTFALDFYSNSVADPSGYGEGETFLGSMDVTTDESGNASFVVTLPTVVPVGDFITATATDPNGNTSEFSQAVVVALGNQPPVPDAGGPYLVFEGEGLALDASASSDPDGDPLTYGWDLDHDDVYDDATGAAPALTWEQLVGFGIDDGEYPIAVQVDDGTEMATAVSTVTVQELADVSGMVWEDFNDDGEVNFGEKAVGGVAVTLTGTDDLGSIEPVTAYTDGDGFYMFVDLRPGTYTITETQPEGFDDGQESLGTVDGDPTGTVQEDAFSGVVLGVGSTGAHYNFGERPPIGGEVTPGQTATIGFWHNKHGQALISSLTSGEHLVDDSATNTQLGDWLAATFPSMYGDPDPEDEYQNPNDLTGMTNVEVANFYSDLFLRKKKEAVREGLTGPVKMDAQVMAVALATYMTNQTLAGTVAADYGFLVTEHGVGTTEVDVGDAGAAFGELDGTRLSVLDLLFATDDRSWLGVLYDIDQDGTTDDSGDDFDETLYRILANHVYSAINEQGDL